MRIRSPHLAAALLTLAFAAPSAAQVAPPPLPPGLEDAETRRAQTCAVVEAAFAEAQGFGLALQDSLVFMEGLARRIDAGPAFTAGSTPNGRAFLTFEAGEGETARVDTLHAEGPTSDIFALVRNFRSWRERNQGAIDAGDEAVLTQLEQRRNDLLSFVRSRGQGMVGRYQQLPQLLQQLQVRGQMCTADVALLRPPLLERCEAEGVETEICRAAAADTAMGSVTFVDTVEEIWALQEREPWTDPQPLEAAEGGVRGASTGVASRAGNVLIEIVVAPTIRPKESLDSAQVAEFQTVLDSLGLAFSHDDFAMVPTLEVRTNLTSPISEETYYLLHTGTLDAPETVWSARAQQGGGVLGTQVVIGPPLRDLLTGGADLTLSAVKVVNEEDLEPVWQLPISTGNRAAAVTALLAYLEGAFAADLTAAAAATEIGGGAPGDTGGG